MSPVLANLIAIYGHMTGVKGACEILGLKDRGTVTRMANEGLLPHRRVGRRYLFSVEVLYHYTLGSDGPAEQVVQLAPASDPDAQHQARLQAARAASAARRAKRAA